MEGFITAAGKILRRYGPSLSIEITRNSPLRCPGCYAIHVSIVGGEPLVPRRTPATYDRILKHVAGHQITVHCTIIPRQVRRDVRVMRHRREAVA